MDWNGWQAVTSMGSVNREQCKWQQGNFDQRRNSKKPLTCESVQWEILAVLALEILMMSQGNTGRDFQKSNKQTCSLNSLDGLSNPKIQARVKMWQTKWGIGLNAGRSRQNYDNLTKSGCWWQAWKLRRAGELNELDYWSDGDDWTERGGGQEQAVALSWVNAKHELLTHW